MVGKGFKDLLVWQRAHALAERIIELTDHFPAYELYALTSQLRRSARSISHNIAEGASRRTEADFLNFLYIARGSLAEVEDQLMFARQRLYVADTAKIDAEIEVVRRMLNRLIRAIDEKKQRRRKR